MTQMSEQPAQATDPAEEHRRWMQGNGAYLAFVAALMLAVIAAPKEVSRPEVIVGLIACSLPSLVALLLLDYVVRVKQGRKLSVARGLALGLGYVPSLVAIVMTIWSFSAVAAVTFFLLIPFWFVVFFIVAYLGFRSKDSRA